MKDFTQIKLLVSDCDGVMTDGLIVYNSIGQESKHFSSHDGLGIMMLSHSGIEMAVITGRSSLCLERRCQDLGIRFLYQGIKNKQVVLENLLTKLQIDYHQVAYIGDDWNDYLAMQKCYLKIAPRNARENFLRTVDYITEHSGGYGAVRDAIEYILNSRGDLAEVIDSYIRNI